jgi:hypothetical protein
MPSLIGNKPNQVSTNGDLGTLAFQDANAVKITGGVITASGAFSANGGTTLGDASGDALTINSSAVSIPNGLNFDSNTLVIDATNNRVGVGTASPTVPLDVVGNAFASGDIRLTTNATYFRSTTSGGTSIRMLGLNSSNTAYVGAIDAGPVDTIFNASSTSAFAAFYTSGTEKMRITSAGNVGIGTSSPSDKLHVVGNSFLNGNILTSSGSTFYTSTGDLFIRSGTSGNLRLGAGGSNDLLTLNTSGNLGLGVTPSASWFSGSKVMQFGATGALWNNGSNNTAISSNAIFGDASTTYIQSSIEASYYRQFSGQHNWFTAPSGTAGNAITFTQAMTLDASGNLLVGTTSPSITGRISVAGNYYGLGEVASYDSSRQLIRMRMDSSVARLEATFFSGAGGGYVPLAFSTSDTERMRIDSSGNLGIGTTSPVGRLTVENSSTTVEMTLRSTGGVGTNNRGRIIGGYQSGGSDYGGYLAFNTTSSSNANTERMRIDMDGNLLVGTTNTIPGYTNTDTGVAISPNNINAFSRSGADFTMTVNNNTGSTYYLISFRAGGSFVGQITSNGTTTTYNTGSDYRLKENIAPMTGALAKVAKLKPVTYTWKSNGSDGQGFIAHELQEVAPDAVSGEKDELDADGNPRYQGIDTSFLVATLTAAIQELKAEVDALKLQINQ